MDVDTSDVVVGLTVIVLYRYMRVTHNLLHFGYGN